MSGYSLAECWYVFEELKPEEMKLYDHCVKQTKKKVEDDEQLTAQVKEIREKMKIAKKVRFEDQE